MLVRGATHPDGCGEVSVIVSAEPARGLCPRPWPGLVDRFTVWRYGATAIWLDGRRARIVTDRAYRALGAATADTAPAPRADAVAGAVRIAWAFRTADTSVWR
jgi:hypothetical protein